MTSAKYGTTLVRRQKKRRLYRQIVAGDSPQQVPKIPATPGCAHSREKRRLPDKQYRRPVTPKRKLSYFCPIGEPYRSFAGKPKLDDRFSVRLDIYR